MLGIREKGACAFNPHSGKIRLFFSLSIHTAPPHLSPKNKNLPVIPLPVRVARLRRHLLMYVPTATRVLLQVHWVLRHHRLAARRRGLGTTAVAPRAAAAMEHVGQPGLRDLGGRGDGGRTGERWEGPQERRRAIRDNQGRAINTNQDTHKLGVLHAVIQAAQVIDWPMDMQLDCV